MVPVTEVRERFYGVTAERTLRHPAVVARTGAARAPHLRNSQLSSVSRVSNANWPGAFRTG